MVSTLGIYTIAKYFDAAVTLFCLIWPRLVAAIARLWSRSVFELECHFKMHRMINRWTRLDTVYWIGLKNHSIDMVEAPSLQAWLIKHPGCSPQRNELLKLMFKDNLISDTFIPSPSQSLIYLIEYSLFDNDKAKWSNYQYLGGQTIDDDNLVCYSYPFPPFNQDECQKPRIVLFTDFDELHLYRVHEDDIPEELEEASLINDFLVPKNQIHSKVGLSIYERAIPFLGPTSVLFAGQPKAMIRLMLHIITKQYLEYNYARDFSIQTLEPVVENLYFLKSIRGDLVETIPLNFDYLESTLIAVE